VRAVIIAAASATLPLPHAHASVMLLRVVSICRLLCCPCLFSLLLRDEADDYAAYPADMLIRRHLTLILSPYRYAADMPFTNIYADADRLTFITATITPPMRHITFIFRRRLH